MKKIARPKVWLPILVLILLAGYIFWALHRPLQPLQAVNKTNSLQFSTPSAMLSWPPGGQSALGIVGSNILDVNGDQKPAPSASTIKILTALTVLQAKPLTLGEQGPTITLGAADLNLYYSYISQDGSVVQVANGEQISEYEMLEAMLMPSANNIADSLATWAFGSLPAYKAAATAYLKQHDLTDTTVGSDASGFSPTSTSTARDLVKLGELGMQNPLVAQIVGQSTASGIPEVGTIKNINSLLSVDGIVGIKTGNNNQDPGVFLAAARTAVNQKPVTIVTAYMQAPTLFEAMKYSLPLIQTAEANFKSVTILPAGSIVSNYRSPNGINLPVKTRQPLSIITWNGIQVNGQFESPSLPSNSRAGKLVSSLTISDPLTGYQTSTPLQLAANPIKPTVWHRLLNP
jgi:D-alanyl-D-alanine carboxypeptidase (penicillin-binding protein 5/6)